MSLCETSKFIQTKLNLRGRHITFFAFFDPRRVDGAGNRASGFSSFAAGRGAITESSEGTPHHGAVVFGNSSETPIRSQGNNEFRSQMPMYAPSSNTTSARATKTNITPVSPAEVLAKVEALSVSRWEFTDNGGVTHMGPLAEDFQEAFEVGDDETIATVDADGVALAAVQRLSAELDERDDRIDDLKCEADAKVNRIEDLEAENERLHERVTTFEARLNRLAAGQSSPAAADG